MCKLKKEEINAIKRKAALCVSLGGKNYFGPWIETCCHILDRTHLFSCTALPTSVCEVIISSSREHGSERQYLPLLHQALGGGWLRILQWNTSTLNLDDFKRKRACILYEIVSCCCDQNKHKQSSVWLVFHCVTLTAC